MVVYVRACATLYLAAGAHYCTQYSVLSSGEIWTLLLYIDLFI